MGWVGRSGDLNSYRGIIGCGLLTGEACCTGNIMLKLGHGLLQTGQIINQSEMVQQTTWNGQISVLLLEFPYAKNLPYMNDTAHNIIQLNQQTVYGSEVAFCVW